WQKAAEERLLVSALNGRPMGIVHAAICPNNKALWLEGLRVSPVHRRSGIATKLLEAALRFGIEGGVSEALGIVSTSNEPSKNMMQRNRFKPISEWSYFSARNLIMKHTSAAEFADASDLDDLLSYLGSSSVYLSAGRRYFNAWRWYHLDKSALA